MPGYGYGISDFISSSKSAATRGGGGGTPFANKYSLNFDGVDDVIPIRTMASMSGVLAEVSYSCWIKTSTPGVYGAYECAFGGYSSAGAVFNIGKLGTPYGTTDLVIYGGGVARTTVLNDGNWHHIVSTFNKTTKEVVYYVDGSVEGTMTFPSYINHFGIAIGSGGDLSYYFFNGLVDECSVWPNVLTPTEVTSLYNSGTPTDLTSLSPIYWYRNGDNGTWARPQWLVPSNENKDKVSNYSFLLDGVDDYVDVGDVTTLDNASTFTYSGWYNQTTLDQEAFMFGSQVDANNFIGFYTWSNGYLYIDMKQGSVRYGYFDYSLYVTAGQWFHFAIVFNGSGATTSDKIKCYINGALITLTLPYSFPTTTPTGTNITGIGKMDTFSQTWNGSADECSLFSTAKTQADITAIYNSGTPTTITGAVAHWKMGEGSIFTNNWLVDNSATTAYSTRSFVFDGVDDEINCGDVLHNDGQTPMSLSAWVNISTPASHTRIYTIAGKKKTRMAPLYAMRGWDIGFMTSGAQQNRLQFRISGVDSGGSTIGAIQKKGLGLPFVDGLWHHVVVTYDGSESASGVKFYVDGIEDTLTQTLQDSLSGNSVNDPTVDFKIATAPRYGGNDFYGGSIDELAIWSTTALTQEQVTTLYNGGLPDRIDGATAWWRMGEDSTFLTNWSVPDQVGSATGTSANMTIEDLTGEAPNYTGGGTSANMTLEDRIGEAPNSTNNALSLNMDKVDREIDTP